MGSSLFKAHYFKNLSHAVTHSGGGSEGQVYNAEWNAQTLGGLLSYKLTHAGNLEGGILNGVGHNVKGLTLAGF